MRKKCDPHREVNNGTNASLQAHGKQFASMSIQRLILYNSGITASKEKRKSHRCTVTNCQPFTPS